MSTTHIFNEFGAGISKGKNLAVMFTWARRAGGVASIEVKQLAPENRAGAWGRTWEAFVLVTYKNGYTARTDFASYSHACAWARARAALSARVSWWSGAAVSCIDYPEVQA